MHLVPDALFAAAGNGIHLRGGIPDSGAADRAAEKVIEHKAKQETGRKIAA